MHKSAEHRYRFSHRMRLHGSASFTAVYQAKMRKNAGPLSLCSKPNALGYNRLGLSVPRRVGGAVQRVKIKRRIREAFRLQQHSWPQGYDVVVMVRPHDHLSLADYQHLLAKAITQSHQAWQKRIDRQQG